MTIAWISAALALGIIELFTLDLFFLALAISAGAAGATAFLGGPLWLQVVVFGLISLILLFLIRPWAQQKLARTTPNIETNARGLIGKPAMVTTSLLGPAGRIRLDGQEWSAKGLDGAVFPAGTEVRVVAIEGAIAVVSRPEPGETSPNASPPQRRQ